ncbi:TRAP transporter substrate-binding protein DctP [Afifella sp. IM 167]|uniref:TRAP transporter substrate-binding protein n=1 Tax=Afifella sp. IM 167 TaxID=2033586 RepID=UPI001CC93BC0|nr:TRAP transporter substrate-binding protein DctP [Afifella sp. IM 167]
MIEPGRFRFGGLVLAALMALGAGNLVAASAHAEKTMRIALLSGEDDEDYDGAMVLKEYVESRTNGDISVEIFPGGQFCGSYRECLEAVQNGTLQGAISTIGGFGNLFPQAQVMDLPYMFRNDRVAECVFDGPFTNELRDAVLKDVGGLRLMAIGNTGGWRNFATTSAVIKSPEDVKGLKIRTIPAEIQQEMVREMGGNPTAIAWPEVYTSLATGVVEGTKNGITDIINMNFQDYLKHITLDGHAYMGALWWVSEDFWEGLSDPEKRIVYDGFQHLKTITRAFPMRQQIAAYQAFRDAGGDIYVPTPEEKEAFRKATAPMKDWFTKQYGDEWLTKLQGAIGDCETKIAAELN